MANKKLNAVITIGGTVTGALKSALGTTRTKIKQIGGAIRDLEKEQRRLGSAMKSSDLGAPIYHLQRRYETVTAQIAKARREQERMNAATRGMDKGKDMMGRAGVAIGATVATVATVGYPIKKAADFETAMMGVAKQVDGARDKSGQLTAVYYDMARKIQLLGREIPIATNDLAAMAEAGARMGVAKENLIDFTRTAAEMSTALQLDPAELGDSMGKIANLYKMPIAEMRKMGDAINYLDDQSVSKGGDIIDFLTRTGGVAGSVKVTGKEMAALGSTLLSLGERSETASTATNAFFQKLAAAEKGTKKFRGALDEIGISAAEVQKGMQIDAQGTILKVIDAINRLPKDKRLGNLVDMVGLEHSDTIAKLVTGVKDYRKQIAMVDSDKARGSVKREADVNKNTTAGRAKIAKNQFDELAVNVGTVLLPAVNNVLVAIGSVTSAIADWARDNPQLVKSIVAVVGAVTGVIGVAKGASFAIGAATFAFNALKLAMMTNPIGLVITAIAIGAALIIANWKPISGFFKKLFADIKAVIGPWIDWAMQKIGKVGDMWRATKTFFGFGDDGASKGGSAPPKRALPRAPLMATARGGAGTVTDNSTHTWHITQQPGENGKALGDRIAKQWTKDQRKKSGGQLYDKPRGY